MKPLGLVAMIVGFMKGAPTFEAFKGKDGWYVREKAKNGQTVSITERYVSKANATRAAKRRSAKLPGSAWRVVG